MLKKVAKDLLFKVAPVAARALQRQSQRRHMQKMEESWGLPRVRQEFLKHNKFVVVSGPFAGMNYIDNATGSMFLPKLVGSYEAELAPVLHRVFNTRYEVILDIGCAEGYYAVGLARQVKTATVYAHDTDPLAQKMCSEMARLNGVEDRIKVRGEAGHTEMNQILSGGKGLVVCDCDGCERFVLDPQNVPALKQSDILVETHDFLDDGVTEFLKQRFAPTHDVTVVDMEERQPENWPAVSQLRPEDRKIALSEYRPAAQQWLFMTAR